MTCDTFSNSFCVFRQVCIDTITVHKLNYDSLTVALLQNSETFYSNKFNMLLGAVALLFAILGGINFCSTKGAKKKFEELNKELKELANDRKKQKDKFDFLSGLIADRYYRLALESIEDISEYFSNMYSFCLSFMNALFTLADLDKLCIAYEEFEKKYKKKDGLEVNNPNFRMFIICLLNLLEQEEREQSICYKDLKYMYNKFFIMASISCENFKNILQQELKSHCHKDDFIQRILELFERYTEQQEPPEPAAKD